MNTKYRKAFAALTRMGVPVYEHADDAGNFSIDAECAESERWVSYYACPESWVFGVHPKLDHTLRKHGLFAEWVNPGRLSVHPA